MGTQGSLAVQYRRLQVWVMRRILEDQMGRKDPILASALADRVLELTLDGLTSLLPSATRGD